MRVKASPTTTFTFRIERSMLSAVAELAGNRDMSTAEVIREAIGKHLLAELEKKP